jgi:hypothetical protein
MYLCCLLNLCGGPTWFFWWFFCTTYHQAQGCGAPTLDIPDCIHPVMLMGFILNITKYPLIFIFLVESSHYIHPSMDTRYVRYLILCFIAITTLFDIIYIYIITNVSEQLIITCNINSVHFSNLFSVSTTSAVDRLALLAHGFGLRHNPDFCGFLTSKSKCHLWWHQWVLDIRKKPKSRTM